MKKKILVCGSAGFIMSNFIRYLMYRSKDYEVVSFDSLNYMKHIKRLYVHRNHTFYIADLLKNKDIVAKICAYEKPDFIINGTKVEILDLPRSICNLTSNCIPIIQLAPGEKAETVYDFMWNTAREIIVRNDGMVLNFPSTFGYRDSTLFGSGVGRTICDILKTGSTICDTAKNSHVFVEDVASLIWFMIENYKQGQILNMPALGRISMLDVAKKVGEVQGKDPEIKERSSKEFNYKGDNVPGWIPDSKDIDYTLEKTVRWYKANKWAMSL